MARQNKADRRQFLGLVASAGVTAATTTVAGAAARTEGSPPSPSAVASPDATAEFAALPPTDALHIRRPGSDVMVEILKSLNIKYLAATPGSTFRGLQESIVNFGGNRSPEFLTCCHEETSVAMAHGYYKVDGEVMAAMVHGAVGVQHASMAIYNAFADRVPVMILSGNSLDAATRRPNIEWDHSVQDNAAMVRDYTKWDDMPVSLQHYAESQVRAMQLATAVPRGPVMLTIDLDLQEKEVSDDERRRLVVPKLPHTVAPSGEDGALRDLAAMLVAAERPVIYVDRYAQTPRAMARLVELADVLQAPVIDSANRANFPTTHPLAQLGRNDALAAADLILALEAVDLWGALNRQRDIPGRPSRLATAPGVKIVRLGSTGMILRANFQDFQRFVSADLDIEADAEASLPALTEHLRRIIDKPLAGKLSVRRQTFDGLHRERRRHDLETAAIGWDLSPISSARIAMEVWDQVKGEDWALVGTVSQPGNWAQRLWPLDKHYHHTGGTGAGGVGYGLSAAVGAALAHRDRGRLAINFQPDGDFMFVPGALWTAAHHRIPLLTVMFNNRAYHQETMHIQRLANRMDRGVENAHIGTELTSPNIDYAKVAQGLGVFGIGPISEPAQLRDAIRRALQVVKRGEPALIDVVSQPR